MSPLGSGGLGRTTLGNGDGFVAPSGPPSVPFSYRAAASANANTTASFAAACAVTPNVGDLMICAAGMIRFPNCTAIAISDTGSGGWAAVEPVFQIASGQLTGGLWYKTALAADFNSGSGITVTVTGSGGSGAGRASIEVDVFACSGPAIDLAQSGSPGSGSTPLTFHISPAAGSTSPANTDELAVCMGVFNAAGAPTGTNNFVATNTKNLTVAQAANQTNLVVQYAMGCQASATPASNTWTLTWTSASQVILFGATFTHT